MDLTQGMMEALRGRRGLEEDDTSQDKLIKAMEPAEIVRECVGWKLGDRGWANIIAGWMVAAGATADDVARDYDE